MTRLVAIALAIGLLLTGCSDVNTANVSKSTPPQDPQPPQPPPPPAPPSPPPPPTADITAVNHIIFMLQENQSFDHYFGKLNDYRQTQGLGADVDVTPPNASSPSFDHSTMFTPFHMNSMCVEDLSSFWNESHNDQNHEDPTSGTPLMDGYANSAGNDSRNSIPPGFDIDGQRVMGYYDDGDLPYYYFMATQFAISDRWFSPAMTNTPANRMYAMAATSHGVVDKTPGIPVPTIFDELQKAGITWKNYVPDYPNGSSLKPFPAYSKYVNTNIVPMSQYFTDAANGSLPQVAFIDRDSKNGLDEHPGAGESVQKGAAYIAKIIGALMNSSNWKDSVFFLSYDEGGGFYDHVPPAQTVSPDGIPPVLVPDDICGGAKSGPACDFVFTGFRLPNFVVSPFSKAHYVDHTPMDTTAILTFIEKRFGLGPLTKRDAAQPDISFFFDFNGAPNMTPPVPPAQPTNGPCYVDALP